MAGLGRRFHLAHTVAATARIIAITTTHPPCSCQNEARNSSRGGLSDGIASSAPNAVAATVKESASIERRGDAETRRRGECKNATINLLTHLTYLTDLTHLTYVTLQ